MEEGETLWGLPQQISDELVDSYRFAPFRWLGFWLFMIIMCGGFLIGARLFGICENRLWQNAIEAGQSVNGFAYDTNYGIGFIIGVFVWIYFSGAIVSLILILMPMPIKGTLFLTSFSDVSSNTPVITLPGTVVEINEEMETASGLINDHSWRILKKLNPIVSPFILLAVLFSFAELNWFNVLSPTGMHTSVPWTRTDKVRAWRDVETVKLGCNQVGNASNLIYEVTWPDGRDKRLPIDTHFDGPNWLTNLETINAEISHGGAVFKRWKWLRRDPLHPDCLRFFHDQPQENAKSRIDALLRIGELD